MVLTLFLGCALINLLGMVLKTGSSEVRSLILMLRFDLSHDCASLEILIAPPSPALGFFLSVV